MFLPILNLKDPLYIFFGSKVNSICVVFNTLYVALR